MTFARFKSLKFFSVRFQFDEDARHGRQAKNTMAAKVDGVLASMDFQTYAQDFAKRLRELEYFYVRFKHGQQSDTCWKVIRNGNSASSVSVTVEKLSEYAARQALRESPFE